MKKEITNNNGVLCSKAMFSMLLIVFMSIIASSCSKPEAVVIEAGGMSGSGFFVKERINGKTEYLAITAYHVVSGTNTVNVKTHLKDTADSFADISGTVIYSDPSKDTAIIKISPSAYHLVESSVFDFAMDKDLAELSNKSERKAKVLGRGEDIGSIKRQTLPSSLELDMQNINVDVPVSNFLNAGHSNLTTIGHTSLGYINSGFSGGPLLNEDGDVIGMASQKTEYNKNTASIFVSSIKIKEVVESSKKRFQWSDAEFLGGIDDNNEERKNSYKELKDDCQANMGKIVENVNINIQDYFKDYHNTAISSPDIEKDLYRSFTEHLYYPSIFPLVEKTYKDKINADVYKNFIDLYKNLNSNYSKCKNSPGCLNREDLRVINNWYSNVVAGPIVSDYLQILSGFTDQHIFRRNFFLQLVGTLKWVSNFTVNLSYSQSALNAMSQNRELIFNATSNSGNFSQLKFSVFHGRCVLNVNNDDVSYGYGISMMNSFKNFTGSAAN